MSDVFIRRAVVTVNAVKGGFLVSAIGMPKQLVPAGPNAREVLGEILDNALKDVIVASILSGGLDG